MNLCRQIPDVLVASLQEAFPAVARLTGERLFALVAAEFISSRPQPQRSLFDVGPTFPEFLARHPCSQSRTYLRDLAQLDWFVHVARQTAEQSGSSTIERGLPNDIKLLKSHFPIDLIRRTALDRARSQVEPAEDETRLVIYRSNGTVCVERLREAPYRFLEATARGAGPLVAVAEATQVDRRYSLGSGIPASVLSRLFCSKLK